MEALGLNLGYLLVQTLNFLILFVVLRKWVFIPIIGMLEKRRASIAKGLEDARVAADARANAEKEAEGIIVKAQQEAGRIVREATERAEQVAKEVKEEAQAEIAAMKEAAAEEAEQAKNEVLAELRGQVAALALAAAQKVIGEALDEKRQRALIDEFFSGVKSGKVVLLEGEKVSGESAQVTSALPLTEKEQETVRKDLAAMLGKDSQIEFRVDPGILGGLVFRIGDKVLDGSVAGKLESLRQSLH